MKKTILIAICVSMIILVNGCRTRDKAMKQIEEDEIRPVSSIVLTEEDAQRLNEKLQVHLYFSDQDGTRLVKEIRYVNMDEAKQGTDKLASVLVKELVKGPTNETLKPTIPDGAALRSPVKLDGRTAIVDMSKEFVENHPGGNEAEEMTIFSIVNTLTELKDIETVQFQVNGKKQKEFKGSFRFDNEFPRNEALIDRKQSQTALPDDLTVQEENTENVMLEENAEGVIQEENDEDVSTKENYEEEILE